MYRRLLQIGWSATLNMAPTLTNLFSAWVVLRYAEDSVWGGFVAMQLLVGLGLHVLAWGNRDYLLRVFAHESGSASAIWRQVLVTRGALLFIALPLLLLIYPAEVAALLSLWLLMGYLRQSFDVVLTVRRDLAFAAVTELVAGAMVLGLCFWQRDHLSVSTLVGFWALFQGVRLLPFLVKYGREFLVGPFPLLQFRYYQLALPFFLLGFAGMVMGRMELYCLLGNIGPAGSVMEDEVAHYQIWTSLLMYLQGVAGYILQPITKAAYRLPLRSIWRLSIRLSAWGGLVLLIGLPVAALLLRYWYEVAIPWEMYPLAVLYVWPVYLMLPLTLYLYRMQAQRAVLLYDVAAILVNLGMSILLIPRLGIAGAMVASVTAQCVLLAFIVWATAGNRAIQLKK